MTVSPACSVFASDTGRFLSRVTPLTPLKQSRLVFWLGKRGVKKFAPWQAAGVDVKEVGLQALLDHFLREPKGIRHPQVTSPSPSALLRPHPPLLGSTPSQAAAWMAGVPEPHVPEPSPSSPGDSASGRVRQETPLLG